MEIESILRKCVHCGMCLATCPTYQLLGDELDSPRGRIYQIKQVVEGHAPTRDTLRHLDRCLTCRNCETTCPSGVDYGHLVDNGRAIVEERVPRDVSDRAKRRLLLALLPYPRRMAPLVKLGQKLRPLMPAAIKRSIPKPVDAGVWPKPDKDRRFLVLQGCVQPSLTPATNTALARVLDTLGYSLDNVDGAGCCGAVPFHLNEQDAARCLMRRNIDAWWPELEKGAAGIIATASGCGVMLKDYGHALADDDAYRAKAERISAMALDTVQAVQIALQDVDDGRLGSLRKAAARCGSVAFHPPCTLQHGQRLAGVTEAVLRRLGFTLAPVSDSHLCCGSAGTYSLFQPKISRELQRNKVDALEASQPNVIATANIGCQLHIDQAVAERSGVPVVHWIELLDQIVGSVNDVDTDSAPH